MEIAYAKTPVEVSGDSILFVPYFADDGAEPVATQLGALTADGLAEARRRGELKGGLYRMALFRGSPSILLVGLGQRDDLSPVRFRRVIEGATRFATRKGFQRIAVLLPSNLDTGMVTRAAIDGVVRGEYDEGILKTGDRTSYEVDRLTLVGDQQSSIPGDLVQTIAESENVARDLLNLPPNDLTPSVLAERASEIGQEAGLNVKVLDEAAIRDLGMGAILAVSAGSAQPPRVISMQYGESNSATRLTFVGKGLTFDSGGLSLKTHEGMEWMKGDMGGAAAVVGAMRAIGFIKPHGICVRGIIGAVENMVGPASMKPGDVLRTMNGKTIEVLNTDAEGRLVLSDVLAYAVQLGATHIVDLATLTGAAVVALGNESSALIGQPQDWVDSVRRAADRAGERTWQLPLFPEYRRQIDSDVADMKNVGGRAGGALTAAALLSEFVDGVPWSHLDIAGTAWIESKTEFAGSGGTGYGVPTLVELALELAGC